MKRRTFVAGIATAPAVGLAGCLGEAEEPTPRTDEEHVDALRSEIDERGVEVETVELDDDVVRVEHGAEEPNDAVANVAMAFVERIADDWSVDRLDGYLDDPDGMDWTWHAEAAWARSYADGEIGPDEYAERISQTITMVIETDPESA